MLHNDAAIRDEFASFMKAVADSGPDGDGFSETTVEFVEWVLRNTAEDGENPLSVEAIRNCSARFSEGRQLNGQRWLFDVMQDWIAYTVSQELLAMYSTHGFNGLDHLID